MTAPADAARSRGLRSTSLMSLSALSMAMWFGSSLQGQDRVAISDSPTCSECEIVVRTVAVLETNEGPGALVGLPRDVAADSQGRYYVLDYGDQDIIRRFGPDGLFLDSIGRSGRGPGELAGVSALAVGRNDSLYAFDALQRRVSVFTPDGDYARSWTLVGRMDQGIQLDGDVWLVGGQIPTPDRIGLPIHIVENGRVRRSFGGDGAFRPDTPVWDARRMTFDRTTGTVWALHRYQHAIDGWRADGEVRSRFLRTNDWFPVDLMSRSWGPSSPRPPLNVAIRAIPNDRSLIVVTNLAHPEWRSRLPAPIQQSGGAIYPVGPGEGMYASRIEWIAPRARELKAFIVTDEEIYGRASDDQFWGMSVDAVDRPTVLIYEIDVSGQ